MVDPYILICPLLQYSILIMHNALYSITQPGGQMYFSDIYTNQDMPQALKDNSVLWGEFNIPPTCV